jgi:DNA-directed RNA polymerase specialized sigma24 family protein
MKAAIGATAGPGTPPDQLDDIYQRACGKALEADKRPFVGGNTAGWFGRVASNVTIDFFRERSEEESHFDRSDDVEQRAENVAQASPEQTEEDEGFHPWLAKHVARSESDSKTFELMMRKARETLTSRPRSPRSRASASMPTTSARRPCARSTRRCASAT